MVTPRFKCSECTNWTVESPDKSICDECLGRMTVSGTTVSSGRSYEQIVANVLNLPPPLSWPPPLERSLRRDIMNLNSEKLRVEAAWIAVAIVNWSELEATTGRDSTEWANIAGELERHWRSLK